MRKALQQLEDNAGLSEEPEDTAVTATLNRKLKACQP